MKKPKPCGYTLKCSYAIDFDESSKGGHRSKAPGPQMTCYSMRQAAKYAKSFMESGGSSRERQHRQEVEILSLWGPVP